MYLIIAGECEENSNNNRVIRINRVRLPNLLVVSCIRGKYIYMYWYSTAVCIGLYTRYIFYLGACTFVHSSLLLYNVHIYIYMCVTTAVCVCRTMFVCMAPTTGQGCQSCSWSAAEQGKCIFPCPRSCLRIWSREMGSAVPSRVSLLISILQAESIACLRDSSRVPRRRPFIIGAHYVLSMQQCIYV